MDIKAKDKELFYLGCVLTEQIERIEKILQEGVASHSNILYDARFRSLIQTKDRWKEAAINHE